MPVRKHVIYLFISFYEAKTISSKVNSVSMEIILLNYIYQFTGLIYYAFFISSWNARGGWLPIRGQISEAQIKKE